MEDALLEILESFKYPVYRQGSMSDKEKYPESEAKMIRTKTDNEIVVSVSEAEVHLLNCFR